MLKAAQKIENNISKVILGKSRVIELMLVALLARGHILFDDVPGVGKTRLANSLAKSLGVDFERIQFTPDLQPADITGLYYYNQQKNDFVFRPGPAHTNILLADEINRAVPRTQASLLEVMEERQITVEGDTFLLEEPFLVIATQNPIELEGTFPLPEAQLDRFLFKLKVGYPSAQEELNILSHYQKSDPLDQIKPVISQSEIIDLQQKVTEIEITDFLQQYIVSLVRETRDKSEIKLGLSPRATLAIMRAAQARALLYDRDYVIPDDIQQIFPFAAEHRIMLLEREVISGKNKEEIILQILEEVEVPVEQGD